MPETNSSSSHAVVIDRLSNEMSAPGSPYWDLPISEDGCLHVPSSISNFGQRFDIINSVKSKVHYAMGQALSQDYQTVFNCLDKIKVLKEVLIEVSGAKDVIFDAFPEYFNKLKKIHDQKDWEELVYYYDYDCIFGLPTIDHDSKDKYPEIFNSKETLRQFLFNPKSMVFIGGDCEKETREDYYKVLEGSGLILPNENPKAILQIMFPEPIGRIDFELDRYPLESTTTEVNKILGLLYYDIQEKRFVQDFEWDTFNANRYAKYVDDIPIDAKYLPKLKEHFGKSFLLVDGYTWITTKLNDDLLKLYLNNINRNSGDDTEYFNSLIQLLEENKGSWYCLKSKIISEEFGEISGQDE